MAKARAHPERRLPLLESKRRYYWNRGKEVTRARLEERKKNDPFRWKAEANANPVVTKAWLLSTWEAQGGKCALSGRNLDIITLEVDHIIPRSRGGGDEAANLRLVCREANTAKRAMLDSELFDLCSEILRNHRPT